MKVMHVIEAMHQGGAESLVVEHVRLAGPGVEPLVCALNRGGPSLEAAERAGARVFMLGKGGSRVGGLGRLAAILREERVDVVNGHNPTGGLYGALAGALARVPVALRTEHSFHYRGRHSALYPALEVVSTMLVRRVVCVCDAVLESHVKRLAFAADRFVCVPNGISAGPPVRPREAVRAELGLSADENLVLAIGSLTPQKAQHTMIEAMALLPGKSRLVIAGEGPRRAELESLVAARSLADRVRFLGARLDAADLLGASDLFVLSSVREGLSITLLEAMRAGRAAVATRIGGNGEALEEGVTGLLVPAEDPRALADAIGSLLADPARRAALGEAARARWAARFTAERMVRDTEALYRAELARGGRGMATDAGAARP